MVKKLCSDDLPVKKITDDKDAQSYKEMIKISGLAEGAIRKHAQKMIALGKWEQVWKREDGKIVKAFVRVK